MNRLSDALVPLSQRGTLGQNQKSGTVPGTRGGTSSLKALANKVLERDSAWDKSRDKGENLVPRASDESTLVGQVSQPDLAVDFDPETHRLIEWFRSTTPPAAPFELCQGVTILDPARWWRSIRGDIECGPTGPRARYKAVQGDLRRLYDLMVGAGRPGEAQGRT